MNLRDKRRAQACKRFHIGDKVECLNRIDDDPEEIQAGMRGKVTRDKKGNWEENTVAVRWDGDIVEIENKIWPMWHEQIRNLTSQNSFDAGLQSIIDKEVEELTS